MKNQTPHDLKSSCRCNDNGESKEASCGSLDASPPHLEHFAILLACFKRYILVFLNVVVLDRFYCSFILSLIHVTKVRFFLNNLTDI